MLMLRSSLLVNQVKVARFSNPISFLATKTTRESAKEEQEKFWAKNAKLNRPLSPHLTIYKLPMTANMSIMHRATGGIMASAVYAFGLGSLYWSGNFEQVYTLIQSVAPPSLMFGVKFVLALPLCYHILTGIRHLVWDTGRGLELKNLYSSGYVIIPLAFVLTGLVASL